MATRRSKAMRTGRDGGVVAIMVKGAAIGELWWLDWPGSVSVCNQFRKKLFNRDANH
jgi:hypothetical protein